MKSRIRLVAPLVALALGGLVPVPVAAAEPAGFEYFHTYDENKALIDQAVADHPGIARRFFFWGQASGIAGVTTLSSVPVQVTGLILHMRL